MGSVKTYGRRQKTAGMRAARAQIRITLMKPRVRMHLRRLAAIIAIPLLILWGTALTACARRPVPANSGNGACDHPPLFRSLAGGIPAAVLVLPSKRDYSIAQIAVDQHGRATHVRLLVSRGNPKLDSAITAALQRSRYVPAKFRCVATGGILTAFIKQLVPITIEHPCNHAPLKLDTVYMQFPELPLPRESVDVPIRVRVDSTGAIVAAQVVQASRWKNVDAVELESARATSYLPAVRNCQPVTADATFNFQWW